MKIANELLTYETPQVEIIEVEVEKGFATSDTTTNGINDLENEPW